MNKNDWLEYLSMWLGALLAAGLFYVVAFLIMNL